MERIKTNLAEFLEVEFHGKFSDLENMEGINEQVFFGMYDNEISQIYDLCDESGLELDEILLSPYNFCLDENMNLKLIDYGTLKPWIKEI